ncbi:hypothetical protein [Nesterenkonia natronophila]|uniref:Uncharacterized protein n=1 Tax=Nesterenkonia natronophila TaxID=2174932 RepID=A0A3A4F5A4_9MICC|nr:hypothetical protein [Nesterenkonia natronophila]RJN32911.1 hypothetical protein D3250_03610 [Nesterenkonia natronophila]
MPLPLLLVGSGCYLDGEHLMFKRTRITAADLNDEEPLLSILPTDDELENLRRGIDECERQLAEQARRLREMTRR